MTRLWEVTGLEAVMAGMVVVATAVSLTRLALRKARATLRQNGQQHISKKCGN